LRLTDYLAVPYMLEAETFEASPGVWISRVSYPELPGCVTEGVVIADALRRLERLRIQTIVTTLDAGQPPPVPRPPLAHCDPLWIAEEAGVPAPIIALIARDQLAPADQTGR
jgi:predicted RNase H-like HicB family nuclease